MTASLYDLQYTTPSPNERFRAKLLAIFQRRKAITPNKADGFFGDIGKGATESESDGQSVPVTSSNQSIQN